MNSEIDFAPIAALDLDPIKVKLMHEESGEGWTLAYADEVEFEYRRFMYLMKKFPNEQAAPLFDVDVFWHYHILDTMKYAADCDAVFGYFLHHFPYVGLRGEEDMAFHHTVGERMRELYEQTFGDVHSHEQPFSMPTSQQAYLMPAAKVAWSMSTSKVAWSMSTSKIAWSMSTNKVAWSMSTITPALSDAGCDLADIDASGQSTAATFSLARPTLSRAAA